VADGQNQYSILCGKPTVFRDVPVAATRKDQLPPALLGTPTEQRMIGEQLEHLSHARDLFDRFTGVLSRNEVKKSLEVGEGPLSYFDRRHRRALGRRALTPDARAVR